MSRSIITGIDEQSIRMRIESANEIARGLVGLAKPSAANEFVYVALQPTKFMLGHVPIGLSDHEAAWVYCSMVMASEAEILRRVGAAPPRKDD